MLPKQIKCILNLFDAFGYNSGSSHLSSKPKVIEFIKYLHISLAILFTLCQINIVIQHSPLMRWIEFFNTMLQLSITSFTYVFIILDTLLQQQKHQQFWKTFQLVDEYFTCQNNFNFKCYIWRCIEYFAVTIVFMVIIFGTTSRISIEIVLILYMIMIKVCNLRVFYYIFCVEILNFQIKTVDSEYKLITSPRGNTSIYWHRLTWIRWHHQCIFEMSQLLNEVFGFSNVATISFCFYFLLSNVNWYYTNSNELSIIHVLGIYFALFCC